MKIENSRLLMQLTSFQRANIHSKDLAGTDLQMFHSDWVNDLLLTGCCANHVEQHENGETN